MVLRRVFAVHALCKRVLNVNKSEFFQPPTNKTPVILFDLLHFWLCFNRRRQIRKRFCSVTGKTSCHLSRLKVVVFSCSALGSSLGATYQVYLGLGYSPQIWTGTNTIKLFLCLWSHEEHILSKILIVFLSSRRDSWEPTKRVPESTNQFLGIFIGS